MNKVFSLEKRRLMVLVLIFILFFIGIFLRLIKFTIIENIRTKDGEKTFSLIERGEILDSHYQKLALSLKIYSLFCNASQIDNINEEQLNKLSEYLHTDKNKLIKVFSTKKKFIWLKRQINYNTLKKILKLDIKGIYYLREFKRFYPNGKLCSHVLGITGVDNIGLEGIELYYNKYLNTGVEIKNNRKKLNLVLTIDKTLQYIVEHELGKTLKRTKAKAGTVIIMEPQTGYVLAMANLPDFDPNTFTEYSQKQRRNKATLDIYEPGSVFKIFSTAALYAENVIKKNERFQCDGHVLIGGKKISCWKKHGSINFHNVIKKSCNVGIINSILRVSRYKFYNYLRNFGMGNYTGIDLPGESKGFLRQPKGMGLFSQASISLGQEVGITAIQLITGACSIYNDGKLMEPKIVKAIIHDDGTIYKKFSPLVIRQAIPPNIARLVRKDLRGVVEEGGTGELAFIKNFAIGGKTGTGQIYNRRLKKYDETRFNTSFVGFFPAENPRYGILVTINEPRTKDKTGGKIAAPVFKEIVEKIISYKAIPNKHGLAIPDKNGFFPYKSIIDIKPNLKLVPNLMNKNMRQVIQIIKAYNIKINLVGSGISYKQSPKPGSPVKKGTLVTVWFK